MNVIDEILDQENQLSHARRMLDLDALDRIYADDLLMTGVLGEPTCSKSAVIDEMRRRIAERDAAKAEDAQFDTRVENEDTRVVPFGDTAVAIYRFVAGEFRVLILILHGTTEPAGGGGANNRVSLARDFEAALRRHRKDVEASYYDGGGHNSFFTNSTQRDDELKRMIGFLRHHLDR